MSGRSEQSLETLGYITEKFGEKTSTQVSRYQKGKTDLDFTEARDSEWQWHQLGHMQVSTSLQTDNHTSTPPLSFYRPDALPTAPNQQRQSTEGTRFGERNCCKIRDLTTRSIILEIRDRFEIGQ